MLPSPGTMSCGANSSRGYRTKLRCRHARMRHGELRRIDTLASEYEQIQIYPTRPPTQSRGLTAELGLEQSQRSQEFGGIQPRQKGGGCIHEIRLWHIAQGPGSIQGRD